MPEYTSGSEWRRWDLHIHTPFTRKNDCFTSTSDAAKSESNKIADKWDLYYKSILDYIGDMSDPMKAIAAIGITDYFSIENYKRVVADGKIADKIPLILPNVELRILPTATESPINIHCIFNPTLAPETIENRFLAKLNFKCSNTPYSALRSSLIELGKKIDSTITDDSTAERKALEQFVVNLSDLQNLFNNDKELRENTIIAISNKSTDGASGVGNPTARGNCADLTTLREELYKFSDMIFTGNPNEAKYFIGEKDGVSEIEVIKKCGKLMPCIHGSDAHQNNKLFEPDQQRYCWIKADPTFNGLKQIKYEPVERIRISDTKPETKSPYQVIESLTISDARFQSAPVIFNDKLNCIIGGKSTGKSILLHNLARAIAPKQVEEKCKVSSAKKGDKPLTLEFDADKLSVNWADGTTTNGQTIVYIPQTYLNRLADSVQDTTEIDQIVEKVLLDRTDDKGVKLSVKKDELRTVIDTVKSENTNKILEIIRLHNRISELSNQITELGGKAPVSKELVKLKTERERITKELNIQDSDIQNYDAALLNIEGQNNNITHLNREIEIISSTDSVVESIEFSSELTDETRNEITSIVNEIIIVATAAWKEKSTTLIANLQGKLSAYQTSLDDSIKARDSLKSTIESSNHIKELAEKITKESDKLKSIEDKEKEKNTEQEKLDTLANQVASAYTELRNKYSEIASYIKENTVNDDSGLQYDVQIPFRRDDFTNKWAEVFGVKSKKSKDLVDFDTFDETAYTSAFLIKVIKQALSAELTPLKNGTVENALRNILDDWFNIKYLVKMGNDSIDVMSPGKKALVLLQLLIDLADSECPILIDQPEDDLDNRSIFGDLIQFIKEKKVKRQIIIVTHNANIVVGADAEEVIVANQDDQKHFEYRSGSIENDSPLYKPDGTVADGILSSMGIQQHICDILEGGIQAFEKRKNKYHI